MTDKTTSDERRIKSVDQAFKIIDYVETQDGVTLSQIAEALDMAVSTAHIHLQTLTSNGYLVRKNKHFYCSFKFLEKGGKKRDNSLLFRVAKSELDDLQQEVGEHTNLMIKEGGHVVQLYKSRGSETIDDNAPVGRYFHPHVTAAGKAILAKQSSETVEKILAEGGLPEYTEYTITDKQKLFEELANIQDVGYSVNMQEHYIGVVAVGVAIKSETGDSVGAITISGPLGRFKQDRIKTELVPALETKKNIIELRIRQNK